MPGPRSIFCAVTILTFAASLVAGQAGVRDQGQIRDRAAPSAARTACVFPVADLSAPGVSANLTAGQVEEADRARGLFSALSAELSAAHFQLVPEIQWREKAGNANLSGGDFLDPATAASVAGAAGADLAVSGFYSLQEDRILVSVSFYSSRSGELAAGFMRTWRYNLGLYSTLHAEIRDLVSRLDAMPVDRSPAGATAASAAPSLLPAVTFTVAQDGMEVLLPGGRSAGRIEGGKLVLAAPGTKPGEPLLVEKRLAGYHTAWQRVRLAPVVKLSPLARTTKVALETNWTLGQLIGGGGALRYYAVPDSTFISLSLYPYGQAPASPWGNWLLHIDSGISVGSYIFSPPDSLVRLGISTGLGLIYSRMPGAGTGMPGYVDTYLNLLSFWVELNLPGVSFYLRPDVKLALGVTRPNLLGRTVVLAGGVYPPVTLGALFKW